MASPAAGTELISGQNPHKKVPAQIVMAQFFARPNAYVHFMAVCTQLADVSSYTGFDGGLGSRQDGGFEWLSAGEGTLWQMRQKLRRACQSRDFG